MIARILNVLLPALGAALAIGAMESYAIMADVALGAVPFATSIVLVMALPDNDAAQPRAVVGGHVVSTLVGLIVAWAIGPSLITAMLAVGLAVAVMQLTRTMHPPAGIDPLLVATTPVGWGFLFVPVLAGALALCAFAYVWHRLRPGGAPWPKRWW
jgi:CBS-domain-containing membrane protein